MKNFLSALLLLVSLETLAQADTTQAVNEDSTKHKTEFKLSLNYNTGLHYFGRTDSIPSTGFFPMAEVWFTPNFYVNAAPIFVNNKIQSFDYAGTVATVGYQYLDKKWFTGLYLLKPFYTKDARLVQSALKAQAGANVSRFFKHVNLNGGADIKFSDRVDLGATAGLDRMFRFRNKDKSVFVIDPSFYAYAGSQNFARTYNKKQSSTLPLPGSTTSQQQTEMVSRFNLLSFELSIPLIYVKKNFMVMAVPAYVMPRNLVKVEGRPDLSEHGENMFYSTFTVKYTF